MTMMIMNMNMMMILIIKIDITMFLNDELFDLKLLHFDDDFGLMVGVNRNESGI